MFITEIHFVSAITLFAQTDKQPTTKTQSSAIANVMGVTEIRFLGQSVNYHILRPGVGLTS
ncbi:MAG: hypothetical protein WA728_14740 [Xanthobacteraceae bacterium]|jgi:hypothetical protein